MTPLEIEDQRRKADFKLVQAVQAHDWSWTIWELMWLCGFSLVLFIFFLPETSSTNILFRRTRRLRKLTGIEGLRCEPEILGEQMTGKDVSLLSDRVFLPSGFSKSTVDSRSSLTYRVLLTEMYRL